MHDAHTGLQAVGCLTCTHEGQVPCSPTFHKNIHLACNGCRLLEPWGVHTHMCSTSTACSNQSAQPKAACTDADQTQHVSTLPRGLHSVMRENQHSRATAKCAKQKQQAGVSCQLENAYTACMYSLEHVGMLTRPSHEAQDAHKCKYLMHSSVRGSQKGAVPDVSRTQKHAVIATNMTQNGARWLEHA